MPEIPTSWPPACWSSPSARSHRPASVSKPGCDRRCAGNSAAVAPEALAGDGRLPDRSVCRPGGRTGAAGLCSAPAIAGRPGTAPSRRADQRPPGQARLRRQPSRQICSSNCRRWPYPPTGAGPSLGSGRQRRRGPLPPRRRAGRPVGPGCAPQPRRAPASQVRPRLHRWGRIRVHRRRVPRRRRRRRPRGHGDADITVTVSMPGRVLLERKGS